MLKSLSSIKLTGLSLNQTVLHSNIYIAVFALSYGGFYAERTYTDQSTSLFSIAQATAATSIETAAPFPLQPAGNDHAHTESALTQPVDPRRVKVSNNASSQQGLRPARSQQSHPLYANVAQPQNTQLRNTYIGSVADTVAVEADDTTVAATSSTTMSNTFDLRQVKSTSLATTVSQQKGAVSQQDSFEQDYLNSLNDGSEFLPDGSSQQDLYAPSSGPRRFSAKDYKVADISCSKAYGEPSPHAELMLALKGC